MIRAVSYLPRAHINNNNTTIPRTFPSLEYPKRSYADSAAASGKREADLLVEELEELYLTAKDEFEIATDSTDSSTIYAASDRESARDALNQLISIYTLYTSPELSSPTFNEEQQEQAKPIRHGEDRGFVEDQSRLHVHGQGAVHDASAKGQQGQKYQEADPDEESAELAGRYVDVETNFDPTKIPVEVRAEVRRRVEQRVRELEAAVEALEERELLSNEILSQYSITPYIFKSYCTDVYTDTSYHVTFGLLLLCPPLNAVVKRFITAAP